MDELATLVTDAAGAEVRVVGAAHSHSPVAATSGLLLDLSSLGGVRAVDPEAPTATICAGARICDVGDDLLAAGMGLLNQGDIDKQAIGGAVATGTHGTGATLTNFSATVEGAVVLTAAGEAVPCSAEERPDLFELGRLSLGAAGVVVDLTLRVAPAYRLHERLWREETATVMARLDELVAATRHFELFWFPDGDWCACKALDPTDAPPGPVAGERHQRVDWSHRVFPSERHDLHTEMEYAVPAEAGPACFDEIRRLVLDEFPDVGWPLEYRTLASDDVWLSPAFGRPTVTISVHHDPPPADDEPLFRAAESIFARYDGRPHWGKVHFRSGDELAGLYPRWDDWWRVRDEWDPTGVFLNDHLRAMRPPM